MTTKYHAGIDPGLDGAIALYAPDVPLICIDMPTFSYKVGKKTRRVIDPHRLAGWLDLHNTLIRRVVIEEVHAMPKQGVSSSFSFGFGTGLVHGLLAGFSIPFSTVSPRLWKGALRLTGDKDRSRQLASRMFPRDTALFSRKCDDGRAEAALMAYYGSTLV